MTVYCKAIKTDLSQGEQYFLIYNFCAIVINSYPEIFTVFR